MKTKILAAAVIGVIASSAQADQVIPDDLIVDGSLCVGFDCVNNESFGFDTIRLKENNTRIKFEDTSTGTFPTTDWQLTANDSASGGANKFSIEDVTGARVPFTIISGAPSNSLFVDSGGRLGLGTATPVLDVHVASNNTPALRLAQDSSGGFTAQTWDIGGNEANFFIRDVTGGSRLSFRIRPGAPTSSIDISSDGDVGMGIASPDASLHIKRTSPDASSSVKLQIEDDSTVNVDRPMFVLTNNGGAELFFENSATSNTWKFKSRGSDEHFLMNFTGNAGQEFDLSPNGNLSIGGTLTELSDRNAKHNIANIDKNELLTKLARLDVPEWTYIDDEAQARHIGPMAQDFHALFGFGETDTHIASRDVAGVALASSKALLDELEARDQQIAELREQITALAQKLDALEHREPN